MAKIQMRWKLVCALLAIATVSTCEYRHLTNGWQTLSSNFARNDKPYGAGSFVICGREAISLKIADPVITFKPASEARDPDVAEPTQAWMSDVNQVMNRSTVNFLRGTIDGPMTRYFSQPGQSGAWWYSRDWNTIYISTDWMDLTLPLPADGLLPQTTRLWRSPDGGHHWSRLKWPAHNDIDQLLFLDAQRGYAVGWGPHVWRTADGGASWQEIETPPGASGAKPRATFSGVDLARDGVLRVAYYVDARGGVKTSSVVERLAWNAPKFKPEIVLPNQNVVALQSAPDSAKGYGIYALSRVGAPIDLGAPGGGKAPQGEISVWQEGQPEHLRQLRTFEPRFMLDGLDVGARGVVIAYATDATGSGAPRDYSLYSTDGGKTWTDSDDGMLQGGYFDVDTSTMYSLSAYTLEKRKL